MASTGGGRDPVVSRSSSPHLQRSSVVPSRPSGSTSLPTSSSASSFFQFSHQPHHQQNDPREPSRNVSGINNNNNRNGALGVVHSSSASRLSSMLASSSSSSSLIDGFGLGESGSRSGSGSSSRAPSAPNSPTKRKAYGDRFIPNREGVMDIHTSFQLLSEGSPSSSFNKGNNTSMNASKRKVNTPSETDAQKEEANNTFNALLKTELFGPDSVDTSSLSTSHSSSSRGGGSGGGSGGFSGPYSNHSSTSLSNGGGGSGRGGAGVGGSPLSSSTNLLSKPIFSFSSPSRKRFVIGERERVVGGSGSGSGTHSPNGPSSPRHKGLDSPTHEKYSISPVRYESQKLLLSPRKGTRQVSKVPFKVLDAPELADDFYLNLVSWSSTNVLGVGLGACVYLWSAHTSEVKQLCDLSKNEGTDSVTSISWVQRGSQLALGTKDGSVQIWDAEQRRLIRKMSGHTARVGALAWNNHILTSGSHDRLIYHRDVRIPDHFVSRLSAHKQEVCGLEWNTAENQLASGGNDNKLFVWDKMDTQPMYKFTEHIAAVKAISWNPHRHGILASGGGTADMKIRFWNTLTGSLLSEIDTGSQVCNLMWSKNTNEIVSTHGFSAGQVQNQVCIWKYPSNQQVATLTGHTYRVLYLAMSPDGQTIVTGAGDETLRFWNAFQKTKVEKKGDSSALNPFTQIR